mmetsp:Transcript_111121/g.321175  ORF Transcript_111121/g.321175 Transcript_111121/m.321175 type:complete len:712 (-) Transcript_111121:74-2209(-)
MFVTRPSPEPGAPVLPPEAVGLDEPKNEPPTQRRAGGGGGFFACISFFLVLFLPTVLFIFAYRRFPVFAVAFVGLCLLLALAPVGNVGGPPFAAVLVAGVILSAANGLHCYYAHSLPLFFLRNGRSYHNVFPQEPAVAFSDAAEVRFAGNVTVDDTKAFGLTSTEAGISTFCIGPVVDRSSVGRVEFWAVGIDCCDKGFTCDGGQGDEATNGGVVVPIIGANDLLYDSIGKYLAPPQVRRDIFLEAMKLAELTHEVASTDHAVLIRWESRSRSQLTGRHLLSVLLFLALALFCSAAAALAVSLLMRRDELRAMTLPGLARVALCGGRSRSAAPPTPVEQLARVPPSVFEVQVLGLVAPLLTVILTVVVYSWAPCLPYGMVYVFTLLAILLVSIMTLMMARRSFAFGVVLLMAAVAGTFTGRWNYYRHTFHSCAVATHQEYRGVKPDSDASKYSDAGKVWFTDAAALAEKYALGFLYKEERHCVAPVLPKECVPGDIAPSSTPAPNEIVVLGTVMRASNATEGAGNAVGGPALANCPTLEHVDFWAVGTDCCDWRQSFNCYANGEQAARAGMVLRDTIEDGVEDEILAGYYLAVSAAASLYGLPAPQRPLLVTWGSDPEALRSKWKSSAVRVVVLSTVLALFALAMVANGGLAVYGRKQRSGGKSRRNHGQDGSPHSPPSGGESSVHTGAPTDHGSPMAPVELLQPRSRRRH